MNQQKNTQDFKDIVTMYIKREGIDDLMAWLENSDFFSAPASTRFHGSETGGLCKHSKKEVWNLCLKFRGNIAQQKSIQTIASKALYRKS